jgi:uncharacterized protein with HEPN domain
MKPEVLTHLHDIARAGKALKAFVAGRTLKHYVSDEQLRSAVERKFEIMGEALKRIHRDEPAILQRIRDHRDIISFRNILVHGYDAVDDQIVWDIIEDDLDSLIEDVDNLIREGLDQTTDATSV